MFEPQIHSCHSRNVNTVICSRAAVGFEIFEDDAVNLIVVTDILAYCRYSSQLVVALSKTDKNALDSPSSYDCR